MAASLDMCPGTCPHTGAGSILCLLVTRCVAILVLRAGRPHCGCITLPDRSGGSAGVTRLDNTKVVVSFLGLSYKPYSVDLFRVRPCGCITFTKVSTGEQWLVLSQDSRNLSPNVSVYKNNIWVPLFHICYLICSLVWSKSPNIYII